MAKELVQFSWTILTVVDERLACLTAVLIPLAAITASTVRMLVSYVHLCSFLDQVQMQFILYVAYILYYQYSVGIIRAS